MMNKTANSMVTIHKINSAPFQFSPRLRKSILFVYFMVISLFNVLLANNIYWNSINGGNWSNPANWDTGTVPGSTDNVFITISGTYTVTLDADVTVASLSLGGSSGVQTLSADGRTLTLIGTGTVNSNGALHLINSIVTGSGPLTNNGNITVLGTANNAINLTFSNAVGATLRIEAGQPENAALTMANGFTNAGTIELINTHDNNWNYDATLNVTNGTLVNAAGGAILSQAGSNAGNRFLNAQLNNQGSLTVNWPLTIEKESAQHTNAGTITVSGGDLTINQFGTSPSFTNSGNIDIANGRTLTLSGGTVENASGGTFRGGGNLNVSATGLTNRGLIAPGASPGTFTITGDVMQDTTAVVEFEIDGYNDVQIDRLNITGNIALAGTLNVRFADSFVPWTGSVFPVMGYGSYSGSYTALQGLMTENFSSHLTFGESELTVVIDSSSASTVNLDSGLVAFYPFNGNADDGSGNGHHGVVYGATPATDRLGIPDQAFSFDGVNDEIDYDYFFPFHDTADAAISFWIRFTPEAHQSVFWTHPDDTDENRFHIFVNGNGTIGCDYREPDGTLHEIFGNGATGEGISVESDTWTNIVLTRQGNNYFLYKNDALVASAYRPLTNLPTSVGWQIAGRTDFHFNGLLDDVYLYNRALNPGEIHELYITGRPTINVVPGNLSVALEPDQTLTHTLTIGNSGQESLAFNISLAGHALD
ncbi:MAG: LamG-like jellyroll fold domain-containing protein, partial [Fidelibacterota bacterium]